MSEEQALQRTGASPTSVVPYTAMPQSIQALKFLGQVFAASGLFSDVQGPPQAIAKIICGRELGIMPMHAMTKIYIIKGKFAVAAEIMALKINASETHRYKILLHNSRECAIAFYRIIGDVTTEQVLEWRDRVRGDMSMQMPSQLGTGQNAPKLAQPYYEFETFGFKLGELIRVSYFNIGMAQRAGLVKDDSNWLKWPENMVFARALSNGARWYCPEVLHGVYSVEELDVPMSEPGVPITAEYVEETPLPNHRSDASTAWTDAVMMKLDADKREVLTRRFIDPTIEDGDYLKWIRTQAESLGVQIDETTAQGNSEPGVPEGVSTGDIPPADDDVDVPGETVD
jgi:hypothetical protein